MNDDFNTRQLVLSFFFFYRSLIVISCSFSRFILFSFFSSSLVFFALSLKALRWHTKCIKLEAPGSSAYFLAGHWLGQLRREQKTGAACPDLSLLAKIPHVGHFRKFESHNCANFGVECA